MRGSPDKALHLPLSRCRSIAAGELGRWARNMIPALVIIDVQNRFFRTPEQRACLPQLIDLINELSAFFPTNVTSRSCWRGTQSSATCFSRLLPCWKG